MAESYSKECSKLSSQLESFAEIILCISFVNGFAETSNVPTAIQRHGPCCNSLNCDRSANQTQDEEISLNFSYPGNGQTSLRQVDLALVAQELVAIRKNDFGDRSLSQYLNKAYLTQECTIAFASHTAIFKRDSQGSNKISCEVASWTARKCCEVLQTIPPTMEIMRHAVLIRVKARFALRSAALHYDLDTRTASTALTLAARQSGGMQLKKKNLGPCRSLKIHERKSVPLGSLVRGCTSKAAIPLRKNQLIECLMEWRSHLPHDCPPSAAEIASGEVYRFIDNEHEEPSPEDFLSWRELNPEASCPPSLTECQTCGLSVLKSIEDVRKAPRRIPALRKMKPALGTLTADLGRIQNTPAKKSGPSHHTWWVAKNTEPWRIFRVVEVNSEAQS